MVCFKRCAIFQCKFRFVVWRLTLSKVPFFRDMVANIQPRKEEKSS